MNIKNNNCFVYLWIYLPLNMFYIGSRTAKNCHINDGYITSSKIVKKMISENPNNWKRIILATGNAENMRNFEAFLLQLFNAAKNNLFFNQHNQNGKFYCTGHSKETIDKIKKNHSFIGKKRPEHSKKMTGRKRKKEEMPAWLYEQKGKKKPIKSIMALKKTTSIGIYHTPKGDFLSTRDAGKANNCAKATITRRTMGCILKDNTYMPPKKGWSFTPKDKL